MGDTCSTCQTKSSTKTEIVHVDASFKKENEPAFKKSSQENTSENLSNNKSTKKQKSTK